MKILRIRFQNLNSLHGIWNIDFTDLAYSDNNLFAITGPTGSGKSTLLDGICLALYGATPRLGKITKASNEIMSRHTGLCFAEVEFSTSKGIFRCHWSQHRSRQKADGELQQHKHEIADVNSDIILESRIRNVAVKVEEVTGMDFDRFTRSTLLAQGGFAAFLEASANERAPILEQITGTEIYSLLSIKVHELQAAEQQKLNVLEQELAHINLLPEETEDELRQALLLTEKQGTLCKTEIEMLRKKLTWLETIQRLKSEKNEYLNKLETLKKETIEKKKELDTLPLALAAKPIERIHSALEKLLDEEKKRADELANLQKKNEELKGQKTTGQAKAVTAGIQLSETKTAREAGLLVIRDVQALDHTLLAVRNSDKEQTISLATAQTSHKDADAKIKSLQKELLHQQKRQTVLQTFFQQHAHDAKLLEEFTAIQLQITTLDHLYKQQGVLAKSQKRISGIIKNQNLAVTQLNREKETLGKEVNTAKDHFKKLTKSIEQLLQGRPPATLQQDLFLASTRIKSLEELIELFAAKDIKAKKIVTLNDDVSKLATQKLTCKEELSATKILQNKQQQQIEVLEKNLLLLAKIKNLEADREQLQDNIPCPLCGSPDHPFNHGNVPKASTEDALLKSAKAELSTITKSANQLAQKQSVTEEKLKNCASLKKEITLQIKQSDKIAEQLLSELDLAPLSTIQIKDLEQEQVRLRKEQQQLAKDNTHLTELDIQLSKTGKEQDTLLATERTLDKSLVQATHKTATALQEQDGLLLQGENLAEELSLLTDKLSGNIAPYNIAPVQEATLPHILEELSNRVSEWKKKKQEENSITPKIITLTAELEHKQDLYIKRTKQIQEDLDQSQNTQKEIATLLKNRTDLFGAKDTGQESKRLENDVKDARKQYDTLQHLSGEIEKDIIAAGTLFDRLQKETRLHNTVILEQRERFDQAITSSPFQDFQEFYDARIPEIEILALQELHDTLQKRKTELQALLTDKLNTLQLEQKRQLCTEEEGELSQQLGEKEAHLETFQEKTISTKEQLASNATGKEKSKKQLAVIATQREITGRWNRLHILIGSADGKKFRNFAQGLTFEMMVHHANVHLQKMNDRYILVRDQEFPLDLNVIDTYQADEIRSTRNLSGGESFLVSLALALGLSKMASQNVRVDSLFLDEGFGTLDEDALESALDTLSGLHEENKLIGIISHVAALKERVPLQIEIIPGNRGKSLVKGFGVTMESQ